MPFSAKTRERIDNLVAYVNELHAMKVDFPTIWKEHLQSHPLIVGIPIQATGAVGPVLEMQLINGMKVRLDGENFYLV